MKKFSAVIALIAFFSIVLSSCRSSMMLKSVNDLLTPPIYYSEYEDLVKCFKKDVGSDTSFCNPYNGDHRSAITLEDIDNDKNDEAIILYKSSSADSVPRVHIFKNNGECWNSLTDIGGYGDGVDKLIIKDLDSDGIKELIVSWSSTGSTGCNLSIIHSDENNPDYKEISNEFCYISDVLDADSDGVEEIFFIGQSSLLGLSQRTVKLIKLSHGEIVILGEAKTDANISGYASIKTEKLTETSPLKIYLDAFKGENQMITELIYWNSETLSIEVPFFDEETMANTSTLRNEQIECRDINNDGSLEIPVQYHTDSRIQNIDSEVIPLTSWIDYADGKTIVVDRSFVNLKDGYMLMIDEGKENQIRVRGYSSEKIWAVSDSDDDICIIMNVPKQRWNNENFDNYILVFENEENVICAYITQIGEENGLTEEIIKESTVRFS